MVHVIRTRRGLSLDTKDETQTVSNSSQVEPLTVRIPAAIRMTGIGRSKLYELIQSGDIEIVKIGSATLIPVESLRQLINRNKR
ncbi:helix-turn-helix domain-containing protein [Sphingobium yanoikuyae]|jgi:excisionase family DNA binding protein|uniref:DNA-binding protein n=1 Tax=Sphingobium yanoikuyae TaxID=13690 RepID=A0A3G2UW90_SPHYA|nr:DNA-binding protein [Sphingobium yanoikuyae]QNG45332.1 helix-turn-helix domain-containing protein [Sphingobium yanoikuyae]